MSAWCVHSEHKLEHLCIWPPPSTVQKLHVCHVCSPDPSQLVHNVSCPWHSIAEEAGEAAAAVAAGAASGLLAILGSASLPGAVARLGQILQDLACLPEPSECASPPGHAASVLLCVYGHALHALACLPSTATVTPRACLLAKQREF